MNSVDVIFAGVFASYLLAVVVVLVRLRHEPLYEPRILFSLAASLWLMILHGYVTGFDGYLAAKPGFYNEEVKTLSILALGLMLVGYLSFIGGATVGTRLRIRPAHEYRDRSLLVPVSIALIAVAGLNFFANVFLVSGGDLVAYLSDIAIRSYQVEDNAGITAVGYVLGFIGVQVIAYEAGRRRVTRAHFLLLSAAVAFVLMMRLSQGRLFQTLVLLGACYTAYSLGSAGSAGRHIPWPRQFHLLVLIGFAGIAIYFMRVASALRYLGYSVSLDSVGRFGGDLVHFALQRGNVPNFPVVFTILDKIPAEHGFFLGSTLFNWALYLVPKSLLKADYLISLRIKEIWYSDVEGGGLPPTAVGEWYANFGVAGVLLGMFVVGLAMGVLYKRAAISRSPFAAVLWANLAFGFIVIYPKTDLAQIPQFSMFVLFSLWILMLILRGAAPGRREAS